MSSFPTQKADHLRHGGYRRFTNEGEDSTERDILDYSANINPLGPPQWIDEALRTAALRIGEYPDPDAWVARNAASNRFGSDPDRFLFADGADSLIFALPRALDIQTCILPSPTYSGYSRASRRNDADILSIPLNPSCGFALDSDSFIAPLEEILKEHCARRATHAYLENSSCRVLVFLGAPNNPVGAALPKEKVLGLAKKFPSAFFLVDESFLELAKGIESLIPSPVDNIIVARSLTKAWAVPGARVGFLYGKSEILALIRRELQSWPLSCFGEELALRCLEDRDFLERSIPLLLAEEEHFSSSLSALPGLRLYRSTANFLLLDLLSDAAGTKICETLLAQGIAVRSFDQSEGLSPRYIRIAVRSRADNERFVKTLALAIETGGNPSFRSDKTIKNP